MTGSRVAQIIRWLRDPIGPNPARDFSDKEIEEAAKFCEDWGINRSAEGLRRDLELQADYDKLLAAVRKHRDARGDDRCWIDDEELYQALPEGYVVPVRDTTVELERCKRFIDSRQHPGTVYVSPQRRIEELERELEDYAELLAKREEHFTPMNEDQLKGITDHFREMAARFAEERDVKKHENRKLIALLKECRRGHYHCDDSFYCCGKCQSPDHVLHNDEFLPSNVTRQSGVCNCGADALNAKIDEVLK